MTFPAMLGETESWMRPHLNSLAWRLTAGIFCLGALLLCLFAEGLHLALDGHHYCVQHRAFEHGIEDSTGATAHTEEPANPTGARVAPDGEGNDHETCGLRQFSREDELSFTAVHEKPRLWGTVPASLPPATTERSPSTPLYRIAPKQSPPVG